MRLSRFVAERRAAWHELDGLLARARGRPERLGPDGVLRLGALYRVAAADLALARRAFPGDPTTAGLERLVLRARQAVYLDERRRTSVGDFLARRYWQRVRERPLMLGVAVALLLVPMVLGTAWGLKDPAAAVGVVPAPFRDVAEGGGGGGPASMSAAEEAAFSSQVFTNNIRVSFLALAGGILLGLGTAAVVIYNGLFIGALGGMVAGAGGGERFLALVAPHGVLELSCIAVAALAGLRLGWSIVDPGRLTRARSLRREAIAATELVLGTIPWLVLAGLVEGFVTGSLGGLPAALAVGFGLGAVYWALVLLRGGADQSRARAFARR